MYQTLILTQQYRAHEVIDWKDAVTRMFSGKIEVLVQYDEVLAHIDRQTLKTFPELKRALRQLIGTDAEELTIKVPAVAVLRRRISSIKTGVKFSKINVCLRDNFRCFGAGTRILMANGQQISIEDVRPGDRIIDAFGDPQTVTAVGHRVEPQAIKIKHRGSFEWTVTTPDHPFLQPSGEFLPIGQKPEFLVSPRKVSYELPISSQFFVSEALPKDRWFRFREGRIYWTKRGHEAGIVPVLTSSEKMAYLLGLYCAEGSATSQGVVCFSFSYYERFTLATDVRILLEELFGLSATVDLHPERHTCVVRVCSKALTLVLHKLCGKGASNKKIPWRLIGPHHSHFLRGLFSGDGYIGRNIRRVSLSMTSYDCVFGAQSMLWGLGIYPSVQHGLLEGRKTTWCINLQSENYTRFMERVLGEKVEGAGKRIFGSDAFIFRRLQHVEPAGSRLVYNLETTGTHSYIANGLSVHNCQFCGTKLPMSQLNYDHVVPRSQGGKTVWENIVMSCYSCNDRKGSKTPEQAGMQLLSVPVRPKVLPMNEPYIDPRRVPPEWEGFVRVGA